MVGEPGLLSERRGDDNNRLLDWPLLLGLCFAWILFWLLLLRMLPPPRNAVDGGAGRFYCRKLRRMTVYCVCASTAGVVLFFQCFARDDVVLQLLGRCTLAHQCLFTMAIGHFVLNIWEDWVTRAFLGQGMKHDPEGKENMALFPFNLFCKPADVMLIVYFIHHLVTILAYSYALATNTLAGLMVQGFLFELPVVLMLRREEGVALEPRPAWLHKPMYVHAHWALTYVLFLLGRCPAEVLWVISWTPDMYVLLLSHAGLFGVVVYHLLAIFFTGLNIRIVILWCSWHMQDIKLATTLAIPAPEEQQEERGINTAGEINFLAKE